MKHYDRAAWLVVGAWFLFCLATLNYNGPFFDEGIYITAGQRTFEGHGYADGYLTWFAGSLLWPVLAAVGYNLGGLVGTRLVASIMATVALIAVVRAARNLFGQKAAFWTALALALNGPMLALARLGVYDLPALAGIGVSFWAVTQLARKDNRVWLVVAAVAYTLAVFSKYPMGLMLLPLLAVLLLLRKEKTIMDVGMFGFISLGIALAFYLPGRAQLSQIAETLAPNITFGATPSMVWFTALYLSVVPLLLALGGWYVAKDKRPLATVLLLSLMIWSGFHIYSGYLLGMPKHLVFGFLFAYPLAGLALATMWERGQPKGAVVAIVLALAAVGFVQLGQLDRAWPDVRVAAGYLVEEVEPGERLLINESWPYTMYLYTQGRIVSPFAVSDVYTDLLSPVDRCEYDWFVESDFHPKWPQSVGALMAGCGTFQQEFSTTSMVIGLNSALRFVTYPVETRIWRNTSDE
ncbi:MAG: glycosyltransferase family 39 protein [Ardenticatenia bacterium]|nr:glycosyltransferase family 39 protein [Ardenticatenia bacterium]